MPIELIRMHVLLKRKKGNMEDKIIFNGKF